LSSTEETNRNNATVSFQYEPLLSTTSIHPRLGPISRGTRLSIVGTFASTQTPIGNDTIQSSFSITTMYKVEIHYSGDILDFFSNMKMASFSEVLCHNLDPWWGTEVHILGSNFIDSSDLCCRFLIAQKHTKSFAKYFSKDHISCVVPAIQTDQRSVSIHSLVDVSINGVDFSKTQGTFLYHPPEEIDANITVKG